MSQAQLVDVCRVVARRFFVLLQYRNRALMACHCPVYGVNLFMTFLPVVFEVHLKIHRCGVFFAVGRRYRCKDLSVNVNTS